MRYRASKSILFVPRLPEEYAVRWGIKEHGRLPLKYSVDEVRHTDELIFFAEGLYARPRASGHDDTLRGQNTTRQLKPALFGGRRSTADSEALSDMVELRSSRRRRRWRC